jgi:hypothetical protein
VFSGCGLGCVFRSKRAKGDAQARLIEPVLWQLSCGVGDESRYLLIVEHIEKSPDFFAVGGLIPATRHRPVLILAREDNLLGTHRFDVNSIEVVGVDPGQVTIA